MFFLTPERVPKAGPATFLCIVCSDIHHHHNEDSRLSLDRRNPRWNPREIPEEHNISKPLSIYCNPLQYVHERGRYGGLAPVIVT